MLSGDVPSNQTIHIKNLNEKIKKEANMNAQEQVAPNNILFIQNLPHETSNTMLQLLFARCPGFKGVRMIEAKPGIAFVEYEDEEQTGRYASPSRFQNRPPISHGHLFCQEVTELAL